MEGSSRSRTTKTAVTVLNWIVWIAFITAAMFGLPWLEDRIAALLPEHERSGVSEGFGLGHMVFPFAVTAWATLLQQARSQPATVATAPRRAKSVLERTSDEVDAPSAQIGLGLNNAMPMIFTPIVVVVGFFEFKDRPIGAGIGLALGLGFFALCALIGS